MSASLAWGFLLLPLAGSYFFLWRCDYWRYYIQREDSNRLFFIVAVFGVCFLGFARFLIVLSWGIAPGGKFISVDIARGFVHLYAPFPYSGTLILSLLLVPVAVFLADYHYGRDKEWGVDEQQTAYHRITERLPGKALLELFFRVRRNAKPILITLKNRKAYVGYVDSVSLVHDAMHFEIIPAFSGYRTSDALDLKLQNTYQDTLRFLERLSEGLEISAELETAIKNLRMVLPVSEVLSASRFDAKLWREHALVRTQEGREIQPTQP